MGKKKNIYIYSLYIYIKKTSLPPLKNGVLRKLKHIFPNTYQRIKSIRSPAKVGLVVTDLITSPVVSWEGWETPPPQHRGSAVILCKTSSGGQRGGRRAIIFILW